MSSMLLIVLTILVVILITLIMLQKSSSIGLGAYSGSNDSLFGAKGPANFLAKLTYIVSFLFVVVILSLGYIYNKENNKSILDEVDVKNIVPQAPPVNIEKQNRVLNKIDDKVTIDKSGFSKDYRINVLFDTNKWNIKNEYLGDLDKLFEIMKKNPNYKLYLTAHTDNVGNSANNMKISIKRAESAKDYLVNKGIKADRIEAKGVGETEPIASNDSEDSRKINRRLEARFGILGDKNAK